MLKIYTDGGYSGGNTNRPALQQMLFDIKQGKADAVVVYKLDRLSRSQKDTLNLIEDYMLLPVWILFPSMKTSIRPAPSAAP